MAQLVDLDKYKAAIGETGTGNDDVHTEALEDASSAVLNFTDRDFGSALVTEERVFPLPDAGTIVDIDDAAEILSITGLSTLNWREGSEGPAAAHGVFTYIEFAQRRSSALMGFMRNQDIFGASPFDEITVNASWGWPVVPDDVERAVIWTAQDFEGMTADESGSLEAKSVAEVSENYFRAERLASSDAEEPLPRRARALLLPYRRTTL